MDFCDLMDYTSEKSEYVNVDQDGNRVADEEEQDLQDLDGNLYQQVSNTSVILSANSKNRVDFEDIETVHSEQDYPGLFNFDTDRSKCEDKAIEDLRRSISMASSKRNGDP